MREVIRGRRSWPLLFVVLLLVVPAGLVGGAAFRVLKGPPESGFGSVVAAPPVGTWWALVTFTVVTIPNGLAAASPNASHPVNLSRVSGMSLTAGAAPAGSAGVVFAFQLGPSAPNSTEIELRFSVATSGTATNVTVYLETPATPPTTPQIERLYVAAPAASFSGLPTQGFRAITLPCTSIGVCP